MTKKLLTVMAAVMSCALSGAPAFAQSSQYGGGLSLTVPLGDRAGGPSVRPFAYGNGGSDPNSSLGSGLGGDNATGSLGAGLNLGSAWSGAAGVGSTAVGSVPSIRK